MDLVDTTLREWRRGAFVYGRTDCMLSIGRYLAAAGARDRTAEFAGAYADQAGALAAMAAGGGAASLIESTGVAAVEGAPQRGDVLALACGDDTIGALCTGDMVAVRLDRGVIEIPLRLAKWRGAWRP